MAYILPQFFHHVLWEKNTSTPWPSKKASGNHIAGWRIHHFEAFQTWCCQKNLRTAGSSLLSEFLTGFQNIPRISQEFSAKSPCRTLKPLILPRLWSSWIPQMCHYTLRHWNSMVTNWSWDGWCLMRCCQGDVWWDVAIFRGLIYIYVCVCHCLGGWIMANHWRWYGDMFRMLCSGTLLYWFCILHCLTIIKIAIFPRWCCWKHDMWVWVKIRYPNNWMVNTKLDMTNICGPLGPVFHFDPHPCGESQAHFQTGWWFGTFFIFHNIWDSPSHWLSYFSEGLKPPTSKGCPDLRGSCASTPRRLWRWIFGSSSQIGSLNSLRCCYWAVKEKMNGKTCFVTSVRWSVINFQKIINYCLAEELDEIW